MGREDCVELRLVLLVILGMGICKGSTQTILLRENFYEKSCSNVEAIVKNAVDQKFRETDVTVPGTLRLFFHDCFVEVRKGERFY
jgi:peroxidase